MAEAADLNTWSLNSNPDGLKIRIAPFNKTESYQSRSSSKSYWFYDIESPERHFNFNLLSKTILSNFPLFIEINKLIDVHFQSIN